MGRNQGNFSDFERISADFDAILGGILAIFSRSGLANSLGRREGSREFGRIRANSPKREFALVQTCQRWMGREK